MHSPRDHIATSGRGGPKEHETDNRLGLIPYSYSLFLFRLILGRGRPQCTDLVVEMGKRGPQPKAKGKAPAAPLPKPQGTTTKCTPTSAFDSAAGKDIYEPEKVVAQRTAKGGVTQSCRVINRQLTGLF